MRITEREISEFLNVPIWGRQNRPVVCVTKLLPGQDDALSFCKSDTADSLTSIQNSVCAVVICPDTLPETILGDKTVIPVQNPKLAFVKVVNKFFPWRRFKQGIHPTAVIDPTAKIDPSVSIGPYCIIGERVEIGQNSVLFGRVTIYPNCKIGAKVIINSGVVIGAEGLGYVTDENGDQLIFPHIGRVVIEDDVEIGANTCIDRGALGDTLVKQGVKIDNLVHIAHNVEIGRNCFITCHVGIAGSVKIGNNTYLGVGALIKNQKSVGKNVMVGMGAVVVKDVPDNITVIGNPASPMVK